jgi:hypothetical protein
MTGPVPDAPAPRVPDGGCLLHIGPYKTGSTAIQSALFEARDVLAEHGVAYPGRWRRAMRPGWAVLGYTPRGRRPTPISVWEEFSAEVRAATASGMRACVSTEDFGSAGPPRIARITDDLGADSLLVVAVLRRLDRLLPSQWQERVKSHDTITFDEWLTRVLGEDADDREHQRFWASHDVVAMAERWIPFVGKERFVLVAADEGDPDVVPRSFEQLLGLPDGVLALPPASNASLSHNATELVRRINELFEAEGWPDTTYHRLVQQGVVRQIVNGPRPPSEERIPQLPGWAAARVGEISRRRLDELDARGICVVGARAGLEVPTGQPPGTDVVSDRPEVVSIDTAVRTIAGIVEATVAELASSPPAARHAGPDAPAPAFEDVSGRELLRAVAARVRSRAWRRT